MIKLNFRYINFWCSHKRWKFFLKKLEFVEQHSTSCGASRGGGHEKGRRLTDATLNLLGLVVFNLRERGRDKN